MWWHLGSRRPTLTIATKITVAFASFLQKRAFTYSAFRGIMACCSTSRLKCILHSTRQLRLQVKVTFSHFRTRTHHVSVRSERFWGVFFGFFWTNNELQSGLLLWSQKKDALKIYFFYPDASLLFLCKIPDVENKRCRKSHLRNRQAASFFDAVAALYVFTRASLSWRQKILDLV